MPPPRMRISAWRVADAGSGTVAGSPLRAFLWRFCQHETTRKAKIPAPKPISPQIKHSILTIHLRTRGIPCWISIERPNHQRAKLGPTTQEAEYAEVVSGRLVGARPHRGGLARCGSDTGKP